MSADLSETYADGSVVESAPTPLPPERANANTIRDQAAQALAANRAFVASTPNAGQSAAQVKALSRQVNALIRLQLADLSGTD